MKPQSGDQLIEAEIVRKGKTAPRVTPAAIEAVIDTEHYFLASEGVIGADIVNAAGANDWKIPEANYNFPDDSPLGLLTICVLVLRNGFTVTGESACASPENFDAEIGRKVARANALQKIWPLEGYLLKDRLAGAEHVPGAIADEL